MIMSNKLGAEQIYKQTLIAVQGCLENVDRYKSDRNYWLIAARGCVMAFDMIVIKTNTDGSLYRKLLIDMIIVREKE